MGGTRVPLVEVALEDVVLSAWSLTTVELESADGLIMPRVGCSLLDEDAAPPSTW